MKKAKPVRQQWLFEGEREDNLHHTIWKGGAPEELARIGSPRNLFDGDGPLVRKVLFSELDQMSSNDDGMHLLERSLRKAGASALVIVNDGPPSNNPIITEYLSSVMRGLVAVAQGAGIRVYVA